MDFPFDRPLQRHEEKTELGDHMDLLGAHLDLAVHAAAGEVQDIAVPLVLHRELAPQLLRDLLHFPPGFRLGELMGTLDVDMGHGRIRGGERPILPAFAVGLGWVGYLARMVRASMLEVMGENYIRAARAFGLRERTVVFRYALKVAVLPTITLIGIGFSGLLSGTVFAEIIFTRPGVGKLIYDMVMSRNFPVVQGAVLVTTIVYVLITLLADLLVAWLDPRVRDAL